MLISCLSALITTKELQQMHHHLQEMILAKVMMIIYYAISFYNSYYYSLLHCDSNSLIRNALYILPKQDPTNLLYSFSSQFWSLNSSKNAIIPANPTPLYLNLLLYSIKNWICHQLNSCLIFVDYYDDWN